jgi:hypothetical protein
VSVMAPTVPWTLYLLPALACTTTALRQRDRETAQIVSPIRDVMMSI